MNVLPGAPTAVLTAVIYNHGKVKPGIHTYKKNIGTGSMAARGFTLNDPLNGYRNKALKVFTAGRGDIPSKHGVSGGPFTT